MKRLACLLLCAGLCLASVMADPVKDLESASHFAFGGVGVAGTTSQGEREFRAILDGKSPKKDFLALLKSGNPQGRCYALVGLHLVDAKAFDAAASKLEKSKTSVATIGGCIIMSQPMGAIVTNIRAGRYDGYAKRDLR